MSNRISLDREEVDRMLLLGMDADRYQTQVVPDLQQRVIDLTRALKDLVRAVAAERKNPTLAGQADGACVRAQKVLEAAIPPTNAGKVWPDLEIDEARNSG
jgi:hypothetical protein